VVNVIKVSIKREFNTNFKDGKAIRVTGIKALSHLPGEYTSGFSCPIRGSGTPTTLSKYFLMSWKVLFMRTTSTSCPESRKWAAIKKTRESR